MTKLIALLKANKVKVLAVLFALLATFGVSLSPSVKGALGDALDGTAVVTSGTAAVDSAVAPVDSSN